jgi:type II secretory pathway component GspD/PulD (secretin)
MIETTITEVTLNDDLQMGVRWYLQNKHSSATFTDAADGRKPNYQRALPIDTGESSYADHSDKCWISCGIRYYNEGYGKD